MNALWPGVSAPSTAQLQHHMMWSGFFCLSKSATHLACIISFMDPERNTYVKSIFPTQRGTMSYS